MPGFFVSDGPYQNMYAPNPSCCSNPGVLCARCARLALSVPTANQRRGFSRQDAQDIIDMTPPTLNSLATKRRALGIDRDGILVNGDPGDEMMIPPTLNCRCKHEEDDDESDDDTDDFNAEDDDDDVRDMTRYIG